MINVGEFYIKNIQQPAVEYSTPGALLADQEGSFRSVLQSSQEPDYTSLAVVVRW
jgi:hypothetical protein